MTVSSDVNAGTVSQLQGLGPFCIPIASEAGEAEFTGEEIAHALIEH